MDTDNRYSLTSQECSSRQRDIDGHDQSFDICEFPNEENPRLPDEFGTDAALPFSPSARPCRVDDSLNLTDRDSIFQREEYTTSIEANDQPTALADYDARRGSEIIHRSILDRLHDLMTIGDQRDNQSSSNISEESTEPRTPATASHNEETSNLLEQIHGAADEQNTTGSNDNEVSDPLTNANLQVTSQENFNGSEPENRRDNTEPLDQRDTSFEDTTTSNTLVLVPTVQIIVPKPTIDVVQLQISVAEESQVQPSTD